MTSSSISTYSVVRSGSRNIAVNPQNRTAAYSGVERQKMFTYQKKPMFSYGVAE